MKQAIPSALIALALISAPAMTAAQTTPPSAMPSTAPFAGQQAPPMNQQQMGETPVPRSTTGGAMPGDAMDMRASEHGMPTGAAGGDGIPYTRAPDLQAAISLVSAGGTLGHFSLVKALTNLVGANAAKAEVAKLVQQYGSARVASFVAVQNFAVDDAVKKALAGGVKFPKPMLHGTALAMRLVSLGLQGGTYYEGVQLDRLVSHDIHEAVMADIDVEYGAGADANYHRIADQAHYDLARALGVKSVKLAAYH